MASIIKSDNGVSSGITGIVQSADSSGQLVLQTTTSGGTATTAVTIDNTQKVTFANSIGFGSNAGITFNNSSALTNSTLNDYETGTFTPTISRASTAPTYTASFAIGYYTKIGNTVFVCGSLSGTSLTGGSGGYLFAGFPFNASNASVHLYPMINTSDYAGITFPSASYTQLGLEIYPNTPYAYLIVSGSGVSSSFITTVASSFSIYFSGTYQATF